jgi:hypothetical protein
MGIWALQVYLPVSIPLAVYYVEARRHVGPLCELELLQVYLLVSTPYHVLLRRGLYTCRSIYRYVETGQLV